MQTGFYWAYDEDSKGQPVEVLGNGMVLVLGVEGPLPETHFVHIGDRCAPFLLSDEGDEEWAGSGPQHSGVSEDSGAI